MDQKDVYSELSSIRNLMERSSKFLSLSGLSGISAGVYALAGAWVAHMLLTREVQHSEEYYEQDAFTRLLPWMLLAAAVLVLALGTAWFQTARKAAKAGQRMWNPVSRRMVATAMIPLVSGGLFDLILVWRGEIFLLAPVCLIFYGLSLISASQYTFSDIRYLGFIDILLGLICCFFPGYGLYFWAFGFGVLHILYGSIMYIKYER